MPIKQVIEIDVTWNGYSRMKLNSLIAFLTTSPNLDIKRLTVREKNK